MRADGQKNRERILAAAGEVLARDGAHASMRDVARSAGVGFGTMHRHFPTREVLLEALLRTGFDELAAKADQLEASRSPDEALGLWLREAVKAAHDYNGVTGTMMAAIDDVDSALHASCVAMRGAGERLLGIAQKNGTARGDINGDDLFAMVGALAWLADQAAVSHRSDHLFDVVTGGLFVGPKRKTP